MTDEPTLADDEARLAEIAVELGEALERCVPGWLRRSALAVGPDLDPATLEAVIGETMAELSPVMRRLLEADVDAGAGSPLASIRGATGRVTAALSAAGVPRPPRDEFEARAFPDDPYGLGPAAFADIDESLHEIGLVWGAGRAHVHLRRRRELEG